MSLARQYAVAGQQATAVFEEDVVTHLPTGKTFSAKIVPIEDVSLNDALGIDPRATDVLYIRDKSVQSWVAPQDVVSALGNKYKIVPAKAPNQPATLHLVIHVIAGVPGVDDWA